MDFLLDNLKIQNNLIEEAWKNKVKRLLFLGSSCIYPKFANQPIKEEFLMEGQLEETNKWYAIAKIAGLRLCEALNKQYGFDTLCLMPSNLYGPGDNYHYKDSHVIPALIRKFYEAKINNLKLVECWGSGAPLREFLHVYDLADACVFALESWNPNANNSPKFDNGDSLHYLNVGSGFDQTIKSLALMIASKVGFTGRITWDVNKKDGTPKKLLDISRIKKLGWQPKIDLLTGLELTIKDFINNYEKGNIRKEN